GQQFMIRNRLGRNGRLMPGLKPPPPQPNPVNDPGGGGEQIVSVVPLTDRVMIATSAGRIAAVDLVEGKVNWQARPINALIEKLLANDDFVAARYSDAGGSQLVAIEASQGQIVFRRKFTVGPNGVNPLINFALSSDGTLVWAQPDRIAAKDLFESGDDL